MTTSARAQDLPFVEGDASDLEVIFERPGLLDEQPNTFCYGCTYGTIAMLFAEVIEEMGIAEEVILVGGVGCYNNLDVQVDGCIAPHGRAPAYATALNRLYPDKIVFTMQGDGDLCSQGISEAVGAAWRGERFGIFFLNNSSIAMTGAQMSPTSILGQKTATTPDGRELREHGYPMQMTEMLATSPGVVYAARTSVHNPAHIQRTKAAMRKTFEVIAEKRGMAVLEILSTCNSGWKMTPLEALQWLEKNMIPTYPLGEIKAFEG
jgi:2-oxoglutarate ferredoxin oxidoreductase subunit beta